MHWWLQIIVHQPILTKRQTVFAAVHIASLSAIWFSVSILAFISVLVHGIAGTTLQTFLTTFATWRIIRRTPRNRTLHWVLAMLPADLAISISWRRAWISSSLFSSFDSMLGMAWITLTATARKVARRMSLFILIVALFVLMINREVDDEVWYSRSVSFLLYNLSKFIVHRLRIFYCLLGVDSSPSWTCIVQSLSPTMFKLPYIWGFLSCWWCYYTVTIPYRV